MKTTIWILLIASFALFSCQSQKLATSNANDEVYNVTASSAQAKTVVAPASGTGSQVIQATEKSDGKIPGSSTFGDDYNDYSYSSRIQRFNNSDTTKGYFDETYTSSEPVVVSGGGSPNISLSLGFGMGYGWGYPYDPFFGWGYPYYGWGYPYYGWGYPYYGWGYPSYGWGYPYYPYYPCCCCYNEYPYYTSTYYGPRNSLYRSDGGSQTLNTRNSAGTAAAASLSTRNLTSEPSPRTLPTASSNQSMDRTQPGINNASNPATRTTPASQEKYRYTRPSAERQTSLQRAAPSQQVKRQESGARVQPAPRYVRPETESTIRRSGETQNYSSPAYRQPKTSKEFLSPRLQTTHSGTSTQEIRNSGNNAIRSFENRNPQQGGENTRSVINNSRSRISNITQPARTNSSGNSSSGGNSRSYTAPSPSQDNRSYSAPSRSSGGSNYSAPARSGSSGSAPSSGSGGGGRRK